MGTRGPSQTLGVALVVGGVALCALVILAAFTPIGFLAGPLGVVLIVVGALKIDRATGGGSPRHTGVWTPAPGWPAPPDGWSPPRDWEPDPSWPAAPADWRFWQQPG